MVSDPGERGSRRARPAPEAPSEAQADVDEARLKQLVENAAAGDEDALQTLYRMHRPRMIALAHAKLGQTLHGLTESVDLVQSVWTDVLGDLRNFEYRGPGSFQGWLHACLLHKIQAKHRYYDADRRDARRVTRIADEQLVPDGGADPTPSQAVARSDELELLLSLLERLPEVQRRVLILHLRDELGFGEIGTRVGKSAEAAKKLYQRGLADLIERIPAQWRAAQD